MLPTSIDQNVLSQALVLGNAFAFGVIQIPLKEIRSDIKPSIFITLSTVTTLGVYFGMLSNNIVVQLLIAAVSSAAAVTGGIDFVKKDMLNKQPSQTEVIPEPGSAPATGV